MHYEEGTEGYDLEETSEKVFHKEVTQYQIEQAKRLLEVEARAEEWLKHHISLNYDQGELRRRMEMELGRYNLIERLRRDDFIDKKRIEKEARDRAILLFEEEKA